MKTRTPENKITSDPTDTELDSISEDTQQKPETKKLSKEEEIAKLVTERHQLQREFFNKFTDEAEKKAHEEWVKTFDELIEEGYLKKDQALTPNRRNFEISTIELSEAMLRLNYDCMMQKINSCHELSTEERFRMMGTFESNRDTVEVQSSRLFHQRLDELIGEITGSDASDEEKEAELKITGATRGLFERHLDMKDSRKNPQPAGMVEAHEYWVTRANAHNALIANLNAMNDLCRKYGITKLTYRNFIPNRPYDPTPESSAQHAREEADRAIVEQYFFYAYGEASIKNNEDFFGRGATRYSEEIEPLEGLYIPEEHKDDKAWERMYKVIQLAENLKKQEKSE